MRITTEIRRNVFGFDATAVGSRWYGVDVFASEKSKHYHSHVEGVEHLVSDRRCIGRTSGYSEHDSGSGGIEAEWWTVVVLDLDR